MPPDCFRAGPGFIELFVRVTPNASRDLVENVEIRDDGQAWLKIRVTAQPERGKANRAVIALLAKKLGVPKSAFAVVSGETARDKTLRIAVAVDGDTGARVRALAGNSY